MSKTPREELEAAATSIQTAVHILKTAMPIMEAFLKECRDMENFGSIVHPMLYKDPERRAVSALMEPMFSGAVDFVRLFDAQCAKATSALAAVSGKGRAA